MEKIILAAASFDEEKYYISEDFIEIPESIKEEVCAICVVLANKLMCIFMMGFYKNGELYFETVKSEKILDFDDIGAALEIKEIQRKNKELLKSLSLWYLVYKTNEGEDIKKKLLQSAKNIEN